MALGSHFPPIYLLINILLNNANWAKMCEILINFSVTILLKMHHMYKSALLLINCIICTKVPYS